MPHILIVDDELENRELLRDILKEGGYEVSLTESGEEAIRFLDAFPGEMDSILLDRMMPGIDGIDVLKKIRKNKLLRDIPVIIQSALARPNEISEGIQSGAFYYLTKPYPDDEVILAVVKSAIDDRNRYKTLQQELDKTLGAIAMTKYWEMSFSSLDDSHAIASLLAKAFPDPKRAVIGLSELLLNAVEHGNAGITYDEKSVFNEEGRLTDEVNRRLNSPENAQKKVQVTLNKMANEIKVVIRDEGKGFNWRPYLEFQPERIYDNHGRGIAMAKKISFDQLEFRGVGNEVIGTVSLNGGNSDSEII